MKSRSVTGSIDCKAHQGDVVSRRKKKLTEKNEGISVGRPERKRSIFHRKMTRKTNIVEGMLYSFKTQKLLENSYNSLMTSSE